MRSLRAYFIHLFTAPPSRVRPINDELLIIFYHDVSRVKPSLRGGTATGSSVSPLNILKIEQKAQVIPTFHELADFAHSTPYGIPFSDANFHHLPPGIALTIGCPEVKLRFLMRSWAAIPVAEAFAEDTLGSRDHAARKTDRSPPA